MADTDESQFIHGLCYRHGFKVAQQSMIKITAKATFGTDQKIHFNNIVNSRVGGFCQGVRIKAKKICGYCFNVFDHRMLHIKKITNLPRFHKRQIFHGIHDVTDFIETATMPLNVLTLGHVCVFLSGRAKLLAIRSDHSSLGLSSIRFVCCVCCTRVSNCLATSSGSTSSK